MDFLLTYLIPGLALLSPLLLILRKRVRGEKPLLSRGQVLRVFAVNAVLFLIIFTALSYMSSGINSYYLLQRTGIQVIRGTVEWNITQTLRFSLPLYSATNLFVVSLLASHLYANIIVLPNICAAPKKEGTKSTLSSISAGFSSLASSAVCCSTSLISLITPAFGVILGPFIPGLWIFSQVVLVNSYYRMVLPRIPFSSVLSKL